MKHAAVASILLVLAGSARGADDREPQSIKVVLVGDSTVNDEGGWGPGLRASFDGRVQVVNLAKNGRSSKSFRDEGLWEPALRAKADYILIQFGHNDVPGKGPKRETDAATTYRENMLRYIAEARAVGAVPILVTSIVRRNFNPDGTIKIDSLAPYVEQVRSIAAAVNVPLIDLYDMTRRQAEKAGPEGALEIGRLGPNGKPDTTHLGPKGQREIGRMAALEFVRLEPGVRALLIGKAGEMVTAALDSDAKKR